jgi:2OG-Fe(II) oxygenase superfamily
MKTSHLLRPTPNEGVWTSPHFLSVEECHSLIELAEQSGFESATVRTSEGAAALPHIRNNDRVVLESSEWVPILWDKIKSLSLPLIEGQQAYGIPSSLRFYRYFPGQRFKMHKDGPWVEQGRTSRLTFMVYLNEGFSGGETDFRTFQISPQTGTALLFKHSTWHEGCVVNSGVKYVLRTDVLYDHSPTTLI